MSPRSSRHPRVFVGKSGPLIRNRTYLLSKLIKINTYLKTSPTICATRRSVGKKTNLSGDFEMLAKGEDVLAGEVLIDVRRGDRQPLPGTKTTGEPLFNNCLKGPFV